MLHLTLDGILKVKKMGCSQKWKGLSLHILQMYKCLDELHPKRKHHWSLQNQQELNDLRRGILIMKIFLEEPNKYIKFAM